MLDQVIFIPFKTESKDIEYFLNKIQTCKSINFVLLVENIDTYNKVDSHDNFNSIKYKKRIGSSLFFNKAICQLDENNYISFLRINDIDKINFEKLSKFYELLERDLENKNIIETDKGFRIYKNKFLKENQLQFPIDKRYFEVKNNIEKFNCICSAYDNVYECIEFEVLNDNICNNVKADIDVNSSVINILECNKIKGKFKNEIINICNNNLKEINGLYNNNNLKEINQLNSNNNNLKEINQLNSNFNIKKWVIHWFVQDRKEFKLTETEQLHFTLINEFNKISIFDEIVFSLSVNDTCNQKLISFIINEIKFNFKTDNINIQIIKNDPSVGEYYTYRDNVLKYLDSNEIILYTHFKGTFRNKTNEGNNNLINDENVWIYNLYKSVFSNETINNIENNTLCIPGYSIWDKWHYKESHNLSIKDSTRIIKKYYLDIITSQIKNKYTEIINKKSNFFAPFGTFYWINCNKVNNELKMNNLSKDELIKITDQFKDINCNTFRSDGTFKPTCANNVSEYVLSSILNLDNMFLYENNYKNIRCAVCCIIKDENIYLNEFLEYYLNKLKFDNVIIYDNNESSSKDIKTYIDKKYIDNIIINDLVKDKHAESNDNGVNVFLNCPQGIAYNDCISRYKNQFDWIAFLDLDEYLTLNKDKNIKEFLSNEKFYRYNCIKIHWLMYGDNEKLYYEDKPLIERFTKSLPDFYRNNHIKSIINTNLYDTKNIFINPHTPDKNEFNCCNALGETVATNLPYYKDWKRTYDMAYIKHFYTKSTEEWKNKMKRGSATTKRNNVTLDMYFEVNAWTKEKNDILVN